MNMSAQAPRISEGKLPSQRREGREENRVTTAAPREQKVATRPQPTVWQAIEDHDEDDDDLDSVNEDTHYARSYLEASMHEEDFYDNYDKVEEHMDHRLLKLNRLSLEIQTHNGRQLVPNPLMKDAFNRRNADRYRVAVRWSTLIVAAANLMAIPYDKATFSESKFRLSLILRLAVVPVLLGVVIFTYTNVFRKKSDWLMAPVFVVGAVVVAYTVISRQPGKYHWVEMVFKTVPTHHEHYFFFFSSWGTNCRVWNYSSHVCVPF